MVWSLRRSCTQNFFEMLNAMNKCKHLDKFSCLERLRKSPCAKKGGPIYPCENSARILFQVPCWLEIKMSLLLLVLVEMSMLLSCESMLELQTTFLSFSVIVNFVVNLKN